MDSGILRPAARLITTSPSRVFFKANSMITQKQNVSEFNDDVRENKGYRYTTNASFSSIVANRRMTEATIEVLPKDARRILDVGCGDGTYTRALKESLPDREFIGFDPAAEAIEVARQRSKDTSYVVADLLNPQTFPQARYDAAIIRGVIHHLPDALGGIRNSGLLSDRLIIIEPNGNNPILKWIERHSKYHLAHEEQSFSSGQLCAWCEQAGFKVRRINFIGFVPFFFPTWLAKVIYFFQPLLERVYWLKKYFGAQTVIYCEKLPSGQV